MGIPGPNIHVLSRSAPIESIPNGVTVHRNFDAIAAIESITHALICTAASQHTDDVVALISKKKCAVLVEKPVCSKVGVEEERLLETLEINDQSNRVMVGYNLRFDSGIRKLRGMITKNSFGSVYVIEMAVSQNLQQWRPGADYTKSVSASRDLGGGVLLELSHEIDCLRWLFPGMRMSMSKVEKISDLMIDVEDFAHLTFEHERNRRPLAFLTLDMGSKSFHRYIRVRGEFRTVFYDLLSGTMIDECSMTTIFQRTKTLTEETQIRQLESFLYFQNTKEHCSYREGLEVVNIIEAAKGING